MAETEPFLSPSKYSQHDEKEAQLESQNRPKFVHFNLASLLLGIAFVSLLGNVFQAWCWVQASQAAQKCKLPLTGLEFNKEIVFGQKTEYGDASDMAKADRLWYSMDADKGFIALPNELDLDSTDPFPWDTSKGLYVLNGFHGLHCLKSIYSAFRDFQNGKTDSTQSLGHVMHCLDVLRSDIICEADDTPLSIEFYEPKTTKPPRKRKCRDWNQLAEYATQHSACLKRHSPADPRYDTLEEWTYCPEGSPYRAIVEEFRAQNST